jgi:hypothetical protein
MQMKQKDAELLSRLIAVAKEVREAFPEEEDGPETESEDSSVSGIMCGIAEVMSESSAVLGILSSLVRLIEEANDREQKGADSENSSMIDVWLWDDDDDDEKPVIVLIADPCNGMSVMSISRAAQEYPALFPEDDSPKDLTPIPGTKDMYYSVACCGRQFRYGKAFAFSPVMIVKIDEEAGEFATPDALDLYKAAEYFDRRKTLIRTSAGSTVPAFCLN